MSEDSWKEQLPEDLRGNPGLEKYATLEDAAKGLINAQELIGRKGIIPPGKDATDEEQQAFLENLKPYEPVIRGAFIEAPEAPDKYELPETEVPDGLAPTKDFEANFKEAAHKARLTNAQAREFYKFYNESAVSRYEEVMNQWKARQEDAEKALKKEWGDKYDEKIQKAKQVVAQLGGEELVNYLEETRLGDHPAMIKFAANLGEHLSEDVLVTTPPGSYGGTMTEEKLRQMIRDPRYYDPARRDPAFVRQVEEGYKKLYPNKAETAPIDRRRP